MFPWPNSWSTTATPPRWTEEFAMSSAQTSSTSDDKHPRKLLPPDLPLPVIQKPTSALPRRSLKSVRIITSKWVRIMGRKRRTTLSSDTALASRRASFRDGTIQDNHNVFHDEIHIEDVVVDEVVVDRSWSQDTGLPLDSDDEESVSNYSTRTSPIPSLMERPRVSLAANQPFFTLWHLAWAYIMEFFSSRFSDPQTEADYQKEVWGQSKILALWASSFFIANWVLGTAFIQGPVVLADKIFYYIASTIPFHFMPFFLIPASQVAPILTFPLILFCAFNFPRDHPTFYQLFLCIAIWAWCVLLHNDRI